MSDKFLAGVVEGFYGQPWLPTQRLHLFKQLADWGLNTYFYAPKDDLHHRALWRETYNATDIDSLATLIDACHDQQLMFIYGLSPGLDIRFADAGELETIKGRFNQLIERGVQHFALLFDDLPGEMSAADRTAYDSVAAAQCDVSNKIFHWLRDRSPDSRLLFCPTPYCDRMVRWKLGGESYLDVVGDSLEKEIDVLWTGPEIISKEISVASIQQLRDRIQRPPVIWDNLHANDYDFRRVYCGPYSGRSAELVQHVRGIVANPNNEFHLNYIPLRTLGAFLAAPEAYRPREAYTTALSAWLEMYDTITTPIELADLQLLTDCYYLPFEEGPEAERLVQLVGTLVDADVDQWGNAQKEFLACYASVLRIFEKLTELKQRELFYAWSRRVWELREEMELIKDFSQRKKNGADASTGIPSETHLPRTYRGGIVARLQRNVRMDSAGLFHASNTPPIEG